MKSFIKKLLREGLEESNVWYHGTRSAFPFQDFDSNLSGTGIVNSGGKKFGGFFFTSEFENAEYYTEWFVAKVTINDYKLTPEGSHPPTIMNLAIKNNQNYLVKNVLDGAVYSDIVTVPFSRLNDVNIIDWTFVGDAESYFQYMDNIFIQDPDDTYISKQLIDSIINMTGGGLNYLLQVPIFKKYYESKEDY